MRTTEWQQSGRSPSSLLPRDNSTWTLSPATDVDLPRDTGVDELLAEFDKLFNMDSDEVEEHIDVMATDLLPGSSSLLRIVTNSDYLSTDRALAARLWVRTLSPLPPDPAPRSRIQHPRGLPPSYRRTLELVAPSQPVLVRLGFVEGLDDICDFRTIADVFANDPDQRVRAKAAAILAEVWTPCEG